MLNTDISNDSGMDLWTPLTTYWSGGDYLVAVEEKFGATGAVSFRGVSFILGDLS